MKDNQFYPTPSSLAHKAYGLFKNKKDIVRVLEPSAGRGDLLSPFLGRYFDNKKVDCCEIDFDNQAVLRSKGLNVIDADFLEFSGAGMYSHIIMNPPFNAGAEHVIKAFDLLVNGELVAIVNAETVKNPYTAKRKLLSQWIEQFGSVEYIEQAFTDPDTLRKTSVEVALIWLEKKVDVKMGFINSLETEHVSDIDYQQSSGIALRQSSISNAVIVFNAAVKSLHRAEIAREEANYYARLLGRPMNEMHLSDTDADAKGIQQRFNEGYDDLKKRAWTNVLHSTDFDKHLSSKAYSKLAADFESVSKLSFTESNVRGFLIGLISGQGDMNMQMLLDCFDEITKYKNDNRAYYKGWKSNDKHREQAYRVKMTRFIIPVRNSYGLGPSWEDLKKLQDFDKTFAMLDGKAKCEYGLHDLFSSKSDDLKLSKRLSTDYFDVRWYPGVGSVHFYPRNKAVVDRLNRMVGKERAWLPQDDSDATKSFWNHYKDAEKITSAMVVPAVRWGHPSDESIADAHTKACEAMGFDLTTMFRLEAA